METTLGGRCDGLQTPPKGEYCDSRENSGVLDRVAAMGMEKQWMDLEDRISKAW